MVRLNAGNGSITEIRGRQEGGIKAPQWGFRVRGRGEGNENAFMVARGKLKNFGGRGQGSVADIHKNMINPCMYRR
jgi:hypothetical protein